MRASMSATRLMPHKRAANSRKNPVFRAEPLGSIRIASSMSPTRALWCPAFVATLSPLQGLRDPQNREFRIFHACPIAPSVCCAPSELRVPGELHACSVVPSVGCEPFASALCVARPLGSMRIASSTSSTRALHCLAFVTALQNHGCLVLCAGPLGSIRIASSMSPTRAL